MDPRNDKGRDSRGPPASFPYINREPPVGPRVPIACQYYTGTTLTHRFDDIDYVEGGRDHDHDDIDHVKNIENVKRVNDASAPITEKFQRKGKIDRNAQTVYPSGRKTTITIATERIFNSRSRDQRRDDERNREERRTTEQSGICQHGESKWSTNARIEIDD